MFFGQHWIESNGNGRRAWRLGAGGLRLRASLRLRGLASSEASGLRAPRLHALALSPPNQRRPFRMSTPPVTAAIADILTLPTRCSARGERVCERRSACAWRYGATRASVRTLAEASSREEPQLRALVEAARTGSREAFGDLGTAVPAGGLPHGARGARHARGRRRRGAGGVRRGLAEAAGVPRGFHVSRPGCSRSSGGRRSIAAAPEDLVEPTQSARPADEDHNPLAIWPARCRIRNARPVTRSGAAYPPADSGAVAQAAGCAAARRQRRTFLRRDCAVLGIPLGTVKWRVSEARKVLARKLEESEMLR